jgi:type I restriction enzyme, S subunit
MQTNFIHPQQIKFGEIVQLIIQHEDLAKQTFKESEDLFQSLLQKAFKGELNN